VLAAALLAWAPARFGSFHFDDYSLFQDPAIVDPGAWLDVWRPLQTRPLSWFTFRLNYQWGGRNPAGYLAFNLALHAACSLALLSAVRRLAEPTAALVAAMLFAVHPAVNEAVCYVFARPIVLASLFCLLALRDWLAAAGPQDSRRWRAAAWFALALLSKEECAAFPLVLIALEWRPQWFLWHREERSPAWRPLALMIALSLAAGLRVIWAVQAIGAPAGTASGVRPLEYLAAQGASLLLYFSKLILPFAFTVDPEVTRSRGIQAGCWVVVGLLVAASWRFRRHGTMWFAAGVLLLAPSSSVFAVSDLAAYRRMYLPLVAWSIAAALLTRHVNVRLQGGVLLMLAALCWPAAFVWKSEESLWRNAIRHAPGKLRGYLQLARSLPAEQGLETLAEAARRTQTDAQGQARIALERGRLLVSLGRNVEALAAFSEALALDPGNAVAMHNRGAVLWLLGQHEAARAEFLRAAERDPCLFEPRVYLAQSREFPAIPSHCRFTADERKQIVPP
jgi:tetratricopeptide (TPR) repeat protein